MNILKITTDETLRENVPHGNSSYPFAYYPENIGQFDFHRVDWHWHHEVEFLFVAEGTVSCFAGTDKIGLHQGSGIFINSGILHQYEAQNNAFTPNIVFSPALLAPENSLIYAKYISPVINAPVSYQIFTPDTAWQDQVLQILSRVFTLQETSGDNELCNLQLLLQIWEILLKHLDLASGSPDFRRLNHRQARLQTMMQYIHDHYTEDITLGMIAASASVSKSGALHIFQSNIHISPVAYLIQYRLAQAARQLCTTRKSVASIAMDSGFMDCGYFCRKFRQHYHMSANEYRQMKT